MLTNIEYQILNTFLRVEKEYRPSEIIKICELTEPTLYKYLNKLHKEKYLLKRTVRLNREYPHPVFYRLNNSIESFRKLVVEFGKTPYWLEFHSSTYCQNMITPSILKEIEEIWSIKEPYLNYDQTIDTSQSPIIWTAEEALKILKLSPTALQKVLEKPVRKGKGYFEMTLISSLILDSMTRHYPSGYYFEPQVGIKILIPYENKPFYKSCKIDIIHV